MGPGLLYSESRDGWSIRSVALWCNWLTRRPLKAKSPGSSPGNATKIYNKIDGLKAKAEGRSFAVFILAQLFAVTLRGTNWVIGIGFRPSARGPLLNFIKLHPIVSGP